MKKIILFTLIIFIIAQSQGSSAMTLHTDCTNGTYTERMYNGSDTLINNTWSCECARNGLECDLPVNADIYLPLGVGFAIIAFALIYLAYRIDPESHWALQYLFTISGILHMAFVGYLLSGFATLTVNTLNQAIVAGYNLSIWTIYFTVLYFMLMFVKEVLERMADKKKMGRPFKL